MYLVEYMCVGKQEITRHIVVMLEVIKNALVQLTDLC